MPKNTIYLSTGSNIGNRKVHLSNAVRHIQEHVGEVVKLSSIYESEAWGKENQRSFFNQVICVISKLSPDQCMQAILLIEKEMGRVRNEKWAQRIIDIDILFYNDDLINNDDLTIPHPHLEKRNFILVPLLEIDPTFVHPRLNKTIRELYFLCTDKLKVYLN